MLLTTTRGRSSNGGRLPLSSKPLLFDNGYFPFGRGGPESFQKKFLIFRKMFS